MYEHYFGMDHTPFARNVPPEKLFESNAFRETLGRLAYVADRQMFAVVTADSGCGKSTLLKSLNRMNVLKTWFIAFHRPQGLILNTLLIR